MLVSTTYNIHVGALICLKLQCFLQCSGGPNPAIHSLDTNEFGESLIWKESRTHQLYGVSENLWCLDDLLTNSKSSTFSENLWWMDDLLTNSKSSTFSENLYGVWMIYSPTLSHQSLTFSENLWSLDDLLTNSKSSTFSENLYGVWMIFPKGFPNAFHTALEPPPFAPPPQKCRRRCRVHPGRKWYSQSQTSALPRHVGGFPPVISVGVGTYLTMMSPWLSPWFSKKSMKLMFGK